MTLSNELSANEFVEFATALFGAKWREYVSAKLGIPRKQLVLMLASGDAIPQKLGNSMLVLLEEKLDEIGCQHAALKKRIIDIESRLTPRTVHGRVLLQHAC